jgi:hypothetical protein
MFGLLSLAKSKIAPHHNFHQQQNRKYLRVVDVGGIRRSFAVGIKVSKSYDTSRVVENMAVGQTNDGIMPGNSCDVVLCFYLSSSSSSTGSSPPVDVLRRGSEDRPKKM